MLANRLEPIRRICRLTGQQQFQAVLISGVKAKPEYALRHQHDLQHAGLLKIPTDHSHKGWQRGMLPLWGTSAQVKTNGPFLVGHGFHKAAKSMQATGAIRARHHGLSKAQLVISKAKSINMTQLVQTQ